MSMKVFLAGALGGALLAGSAVGTAWYACTQPKGPAARACEGASHASERLSPMRGLGKVLARFEKAAQLRPGETDTDSGLPDEPMPQGEPAPGDSVMPNASDPAPIVIPD